MSSTRLRRIRFIPRFDLSCEIHRGNEPFPCPWPECARGIPEDRFVSFGDHLPDREYFRVEWPAYKGEPYFSWETEHTGYWFSGQSIVSRELQRRLPRPAGSTVAYHYTNAAALMGIVESGDLWLTDLAYLNDAKELAHGVELAQSILSEPDPIPTQAKLRAAWFLALQQRPAPRICMVAFSSHGDSLSQWRAYGNVALGFDLAGDLGHSPGSIVNRVIYDPAQQEDLIRLFLHHNAAALALDSRAASMDDIAVGATIGRLYQHLAFLKTPAFTDEREVRLVYIEDADVMESLGMPCAARRFRVTRGGPAPYSTTRDISPIHYPDRLPLRDVVIGPQPYAELVLRGVREYLAASGYGSVTVRSSQIPFRPHATLAPPFA